MSTPSSSFDYKVGRGRPPKHTQFPKGVSGNPGGRRKAPPSLKETLATVAASEITIREGGQQRVVSSLEAILLAQVKAALGGT